MDTALCILDDVIGTLQRIDPVPLRDEDPIRILLDQESMIYREIVRRLRRENTELRNEIADLRERITQIISGVELNVYGRAYRSSWSDTDQSDDESVEGQ